MCFIFDQCSSHVDIFFTAGQVPTFEPFLSLCLDHFDTFQPVVLHHLQTDINAVMIMQVIFSNVEYLDVLFHLVYSLLDLLIIFRSILKMFQ